VCVPLIVIIAFGFAIFAAGWGEDSGMGMGWGRPWRQAGTIRKMGGVYEKSALRNSNEPDYVTFAHETQSMRTQWRDMNYNRWHSEMKPSSENFEVGDDGYYYPAEDEEFRTMTSSHVEGER